MFNKILRKLKDKLDLLNYISPGVKIGKDAYIKGSKISGNINLGARVRLYKVDMSGHIEIGDNTSIWGPNTDLYAKINKISIGKFCSIARNVSIQEYNHKYSRVSSHFVNQNVFDGKNEKDIYSNGNIEVGNDVWIGAHSIILSGSTIGHGAIIASNSVVNGNVPPYAIVGGSPAKVIKYRFDPNIIATLLELNWWDWSLEKIKNNKSLFLNEFLNENSFTSIK